MNIKDYEYVLEIAEQGSISKAAEKLYITQGAMTKYLQRLEQKLSTRLFYHMGNRLLPTRAGELYLNKARQIFFLDHELLDQIAQLAFSQEISLGLGYSMGLQPFIIEYLLPSFFNEFPDSSVRLQENNCRILVQDLEDEKLDLCLAYVSAEDMRSTLDYDLLATSFLVLAVPVDSPLLESSEKRKGFPYPVLKDNSWLNQPFIQLPSLGPAGIATERYFKKTGRRPVSRLIVDDARIALTAVEQKLGNCLLTAIPHTDKLVRYLILPDLLREEQQIYLVSRKKDNPGSLQQGMIRHAHQLYKDFYVTI